MPSNLFRTPVTRCLNHVVDIAQRLENFHIGGQSWISPAASCLTQTGDSQKNTSALNTKKIRFPCLISCINFSPHDRALDSLAPLATGRRQHSTAVASAPWKGDREIEQCNTFLLWMANGRQPLYLCSYYPVDEGAVGRCLVYSILSHCGSCAVVCRLFKQRLKQSVFPLLFHT